MAKSKKKPEETPAVPTSETNEKIAEQEAPAVVASETLLPPVENIEYHPKEESLIIPDGKVLVDKKLFFQAVQAMVQGHTHGWIHGSALQRFGQMVGITDYNEQKKWFDEVYKFVRESA